MENFSDAEIEQIVRELTRSDEKRKEAALVSGDSLVDFLKSSGLLDLAVKVANAVAWVIEKIRNFFSS